jgi:hypothetical protein
LTEFALSFQRALSPPLKATAAGGSYFAEALAVGKFFAQKPLKGNYQAIKDLNIETLWMIAPIEESYVYNERIQISTL